MQSLYKKGVQSHHIIWILVVFSVLSFSSCEKEIKINLSNGAPQLVVNGQIETNNPPYVVLTHSIGYFSKIDLLTLQNSFIHDAIVKVSDGTREVQLKEYTLDTSNGQTVAKFYIYTLDISDPNSLDFLGVTGKSYTLTIISDGKTYTSTTKIPFPQPVDSIVAIAPNPLPIKAPTAMELSVYYSDPDTLGNAIRYFTRRNNEPYYPGLNSVFDDAVINGTKNGKYRLPVGSGNNSGTYSDSTGYVFKGDTVTLKWAAIDRGVFDFYSTLDYSLASIGNPFSSPINVKSNVSNAALGVWAGYGTSFTTIIIPK